MDRQRILRQLYLPPKRHPWSKRLTATRNRARAWIRHRSWRLAGAAVVGAAWLSAHLYYFNTLVALEWDVKVAKAQIKAQEQRRYHIRQNLVRIVATHSKYEESVFEAVTSMRTGAPTKGMIHGAPARAGSPSVGGAAPSLAPALPPGSVGGAAPSLAPALPAVPSGSAAPTAIASGAPAPPPPAVAAPAAPPPTAPSHVARAPRAPQAPGAAVVSPFAPEDPTHLLAQLKFVAEQYPELRIAESFVQMSSAVINSEIDIAKKISEYNVAVNNYTTALDTFPGRIFAKISGFQSYPYYEVDEEKLKYREVSF